MQREMAEVYCGCSVSCKAGKEQEMNRQEGERSQ